MYRRGDGIVQTHDDVVTFHRSAFAWWCERCRLDHLGRGEPDPAPLEGWRLERRRDEHRRAVADALATRGIDVAHAAAADFDRAHRETIAAMEGGRQAIQGAALRHDGTEGLADFLLRVDEPSELGPWSYEPLICAPGAAGKVDAVLRAAACARALGAVQGRLPEQLHVAVPPREVETVPARDPLAYLGLVLADLREAAGSFHPERPPLPDVRADHGRWSRYARRVLEALDHPSLIAGATPADVERLHDRGLDTIAAVAGAAPDGAGGEGRGELERLRAQARIQRASRGRRVPLHEPIPGGALARLPPESPHDVYLAPGALEGVAREGFEAIVDALRSATAADARARVYHHGPEVVRALRLAMGAHGTREREVDALLRAEVFVDVRRIFVEGVRAGVTGFELEDLEALHSDRPLTPEASLRGLVAWLRGVQREAGVSFTPPPPPLVPRGAPSWWWRAESLAAEILAAHPPAPPRRLLAELLLFHRREERAFWWDHFDRRAMSEDELRRDPGCLAGLERVAPPARRRGAVHTRYRFDPLQPSDVEAGERYAVAATGETVTLAAVDLARGTAELSSAWAPPERLSLIPRDPVPTRELSSAIHRTVEAWWRGEPLPGALDALLSRRAPPCGLAGAGEPGTVAVIEGPAASGKTRLAAREVVRLIALGRTVGVTARTHAAIDRLVLEVLALARSERVPVPAVKVGRRGQLAAVRAVRVASSAAHLELARGPCLVAGTAWTMSHPRLAARLDVLVADDASDLSLADAAAMAASAQSVILAGDPTREGLRLRGTHPGDSGRDVLGWVLDGSPPGAFGAALVGTSLPPGPEEVRHLPARDAIAAIASLPLDPDRSAVVVRGPRSLAARLRAAFPELHVSTARVGPADTVVVVLSEDHAVDLEALDRDVAQARDLALVVAPPELARARATTVEDLARAGWLADLLGLA